VRVLHGECEHEARVEIRCEHCERELSLDELRAKPRWALTDASSLAAPGAVSGRRLYEHGEGVALDG
jgi:hypothetical protein